MTRATERERASWLTNYTKNTMDSAPLGIKRGEEERGEREEGETPNKTADVEWMRRRSRRLSHSSWIVAPISDFTAPRRSLDRLVSWRSPDSRERERGRPSFYSFSLSLSLSPLTFIWYSGFYRSRSPANVVEGVYRKLGRGCQKRPRSGGGRVVAS